MTIPSSKLPRLSGNTPTAILGWFKELESESIMPHPDDGWSDLVVGEEPFIEPGGERFLEEDMRFARELCKEYKVCIYTVSMVAANSKPLITIYKNRDGFEYSLLSDVGGEVLKVDGFDSQAEVYETLTNEAHNQLKMDVEDYFFADLCHLGLWVPNLSTRQQRPIAESVVIGDFGPVFCVQNNQLERQRIEATLNEMKRSADGADYIDDVIFEFGPILNGQNKALEESLKEVKLSDELKLEAGTDYFVDLLSGRPICNPYDSGDAPATEYGYRYIQWYLGQLKAL
ncbi:hypothetical protein AB4455_12405 [Vibrio sp. 10N.261.46.E12]|uniref:hypothetical protein n=1 Tax=unclassified Vibrio TaxID=2614977 RepID=UPI000C848330|nr:MULTISPECIES: hypothetical protein [unclassified Vibrio]PMM76613.1 hypothetical protein BCT48_02245 [Vibrio sp. 10N.261.46.F12]PMM86937.1 hypothetical protein BCT46_07160 [Vibrio sp. 10N.261.46.E8]PMN77292.1 hypothetical protein BCT22_21240 [Vibrio sp. 10N.261.45.A1]